MRIELTYKGFADRAAALGAKRTDLDGLYFLTTTGGTYNRYNSSYSGAYYTSYYNPTAEEGRGRARRPRPVLIREHV